MVRDKVKSGLYTSASEVIREALRLMAEQDSIRQAKLDLLRQDIHDMPKITLRPLAVEDLAEIWDYIASEICGILISDYRRVP